MTHTHNTHTHAHPQSSTLRAPWLLERGLLIDQSALTAVWREPLTLWLQRVCVQCPCKGSLAPTLGVSALPWRRWHTHTHTHAHTHTRAAHYNAHTCRRRGGVIHSTPKPLRYAQPQSSKCVHPVWKVETPAGSSSCASVQVDVCVSSPGSSLAPLARWASSAQPLLKHWLTPAFHDTALLPHTMRQSRSAASITPCVLKII